MGAATAYRAKPASETIEVVDDIVVKLAWRSPEDLLALRGPSILSGTAGREKMDQQATNGERQGFLLLPQAMGTAMAYRAKPASETIEVVDDIVVKLAWRSASR
ncbi:hypothetical protein F5887DRAFT_1072665 [Amanita rubescens]|nr:hypothetical protein F5887DRAFT_1072665 [Amanita rubescens]